MTTLWNIGLSTSDRFVRDFVSLEDEGQQEDEVINVGPIYYDGAKGQTPADILPKLLLKQPDVFVVPNLTDAKTIGMLCEKVNKHHKMVISRVHAKDSVEALLRVLELKAPADQFAKAVTVVLNSRLVRKLCNECKQGYQPPPQLLQKLGIPPGRVSLLYREYQPPPPEEQVDEKGRPIEIPVCEECGGVGYLGRTSIFELLKVTDKIREVLSHATETRCAAKGRPHFRSANAPRRGHFARGSGDHFPAGATAGDETLNRVPWALT